MYAKDDRIRIIAGPFAGMSATVVKTMTDSSQPLTHAVPDNVGSLVGYSFRLTDVERLDQAATGQ